MNKTDASKQLREVVRILERKLGVLEENEMTCCGVSMAQCHAVVEIGRASSISLNELAELLSLENSTMSRTVNSLVTRGLVKRDIDPSDRRYVSISLSDSGVALFNGIEEGMNQYFCKILDTIPENKRSQVIESLEMVVDAIVQNECCKIKKNQVTN